MKKKILVFNGYYFPAKKSGGPATSIRNAADACCNEFDFYIISLNHDLGEKKIFDGISEGWNRVGSANVMYVPDRYFDFSRKHLCELFSELKPDVVWFSGILHPEIKLLTLKLSKSFGFPVIFSPRGEVSKDRVTKLKPYKKLPYLFLMRLFKVYRDAFFHATSDDEVEGLINYIGADRSRIFEIRNISVSPQPKRRNYEKNAGEIRAVFISRIHEVKNLKLAVSACAAVRAAKVTFDIYGPKEQAEYWRECEQIIAEAPSNVQINYKGVLTYDKVGETFRRYDCFIFPTLNENYGHVIAESLANGCPVILSRGTTPWDGLDNSAGIVCAAESEAEFTAAIEKIASLDLPGFMKLSDSSVDYYAEKQKEADAVKGHIDMFYAVASK